ncbi:MAG: hypothetical protein ABL999_20630 [Pyrinomonadaceae bacterium]
MSLNLSVFLTKRRRAIYGMAAFCLVTVVAVGVIASNRWFPQTSISSAIENVPDLAVAVSAKAEPETVPVAQPSPTPERITAELIVITPRGFEPSVIRRPAGRVLLAVVNKSEQPDMTLRLLGPNNVFLRQMAMPRNRRRFSIPITLTPGRYRIVDVNRPNVVCNIEITP